MSAYLQGGAVLSFCVPGEFCKDNDSANQKKRQRLSKKMYQPFFWGDYFRDTGDLSLVEHGAYLKLIGTYWSTGRPIPSDAVRMRRACGAVSDEEAAAALFVLQTYFHQEGDVWRHRRIERDLAEHAHRAELASTAAKKAAEARWSPSKEDADSSSKRMRSASVSDGNHSTPLHSIPNPSAIALERAPGPSMSYCPPEISMAFDQVFNAYPASRRNKRTALPIFVSMNLHTDVDAILAGITNLKSSPRWTDKGGQYIPSLDLFLERKEWEGMAKPIDYKNHDFFAHRRNKQ